MEVRYLSPLRRNAVYHLAPSDARCHLSNDPISTTDPEPHHDNGIDPTPDERAFLTALNQYKRTAQRSRPTMIEVFQVLLSMGYRQVDPPGPLPAGPSPQGAVGGPSKFRQRRPVIAVGPLPTPNPPEQ